MNKTRKPESTRRDPVDVALLWTMFVSLALLAACISVLSPLAYLWIMGLAGIVVTLAVSVTAAASMFDDGPLGFIVGAEVAKGAFQIAGAILIGLLDASSN